MSNTQFPQQLGSGTYGNVFAISEDLAKKYFKSKGIFLRELIVSKRLSGHPNIVTLIDYSFSELSLTISRWECSLKTVIESGLGDDKQRLHFLKEVATGLAHMHSLNVAHGDIKPSNIMINLRELRACLIDWSTSSTPGYIDSNFSTPLYREANPNNAFASDVYSLGLTALVLFAGIILVRPMNYILPSHICSRIHNSEIRLLVSSMLKQDSDSRPRAMDVAGVVLEPRNLDRARPQSHMDGIADLQRALYLCKCDKLSSWLKPLLENQTIIEYLFRPSSPRPDLGQ